MELLTITLFLIVTLLNDSTIVLRGILLPEIIFAISLISSILGGLFTILGPIWKRLIETGKTAYRSNLVLISFTLGYAAAFTLILLVLYLITGNVIILLVGGVLAASLPFAYGYYISHTKRKN